MSYQPPGVTITSTGPQAPVLTGPPPKTILVLATFPQGPDYPVVVPPVQMASIYGDPFAIGSVGYTGPYMQYFAGLQQAPGGGPVQFLVARVGVARGVFVVQDSAPATCFTLSAVGAYAGSASQYLQLKLTVASGVVTSITFTDSRTSAIVGTPLAHTSIGGAYDLSSNAKIVAAINATNPLANLGSVAIAAVGASSNVPVAINTATAFTTGTDGKGAAYNDSTVAGLLSSSLWTQADYAIAAYDASTIGATILSHLSTALGQNNWRKAVLGPVAGTTFATLSGGSYIGSSLQSSRLVVIGHDALLAQHPATGAQTAFDGFYGAAAVAGLKASGVTHETLINFAIAGFGGLSAPSDKAAGLSWTDFNTLSSSGFTTLYSTAQDPTLRMRDSLSTAPLTINGGAQVNLYAYWNVQDIDDAVSQATVQALQVFKGRPSATPQQSAGLMYTAVGAAINSLGPVTNGLNGDGTQFVQDPTSGNITGTVSYKTRLGIRNVAITTGFTAS